MGSPFFGLSVGVRALNTAQRALEVISHNIANINTPGASRQETVLRTTNPYHMPSLNRSIGSGQVGTGVEVQEIRRLHDEYIEKQLKNELQSMGKWDISQNVLGQIENIFAEPSENGLRSMMDAYWNSWQEMESDPENHAKRNNIIENSRSMCNFFKGINDRMNLLKKDINIEIGNKVVQINDYADQIKELNGLIKDITAGGDNPNDLMDRRDTLIQNLSQIVNVNTRKSENSQIDIYIEGSALVRGGSSYKVQANMNATTGYYDIQWENSGQDVSVKNGELYALLNFRDTYIDGIVGRMDDFASELISRTNAAHSTGFGLDGAETGHDFFTGTGIADIQVNQVLADNVDYIAAANTTGQPGDNSNIADILDLRNQLVLNGNTVSFDDHYNNTIVDLGIDGQQCQREFENTSLILEKISLRRENVSGISLDEELTNMIKYQHAYSAAAKVISTMDEMMGIVINGMGV